MLDFSYNAYPDGEGLLMLDGLGSMRGKTVVIEGSHVAFAILGDEYKFVGNAEDKWAAFSLIERWYDSQENYYKAFA
ncbi:hypothetical protein [Nonomuraea sp. NPDC049129]|uniref:hypothetical protein n=1 Tax=Nonomuraea sp. NPDC049129 TaxID=3155272 RepID=UPI0033E1C1FE